MKSSKASFMLVLDPCLIEVQGHEDGLDLADSAFDQLPAIDPLTCDCVEATLIRDAHGTLSVPVIVNSPVSLTTLRTASAAFDKVSLIILEIRCK